MEGKFLDRFSSVFELDLPPNLQTMKDYIEFIVPKVQAWSEDLRETQFWLNKSWLEIHDNDAWDRTFIHIFMPDGEHFMSDNGVVNRSNWQTLPKSNSLILNQGRETILYDLVFLNSDLLILKQNGTSRYFVLGAERFVKGRIKHDWRAAMEALYNIYRENSKFSVYVFGLIAVIIIFLVLTFL
jgi:hypothetical protein